MDVTAAEVAALDAAGVLTGLFAVYEPEPGEDHGNLTFFEEAPSNAVQKTTAALTKLRAGNLPAVTPVPATISDRQFAQALAIKGLITQDEALAWVRVGTVPAALQAAVDAISDPDQRFAADMLLSGATVFERSNAMVSVLRDAMKKTDADLDALWTLGASL